MKTKDIIEVIKRFKYDDKVIIVVQVRDTFMYFVSHRGEMFMDALQVKQSFIRKLSTLFGAPLIPQPLFEEIQQVLIQGAIQTIDKFKEDDSPANQNLDKMEEKTKSECNWQARCSVQGLTEPDIMFCRTHNQEVKIIKGKLPECPKQQKNSKT